jgi:hypothetical protein
MATFTIDSDDNIMALAGPLASSFALENDCDSLAPAGGCHHTVGLGQLHLY